MKVALIIERMEPWRGGAETSTVQFAGHLARLGCEVHMITATHMPSTPELRVVPLSARSTLRSTRTLIFSRRAAQYVRSQDYDIVHAITPCIAADVYEPRGGTVPETLKRNLAIRSSSAARGLKRLGQSLNLKYRTLLRLERNLLNRSPAPVVIALSDYVCRQLSEHYAFDESHVRKVFNGVDPDISTPRERSQHRHEIREQFDLKHHDYVLLCVAHNFKLKGVGRLIEALALLKGSTADRRAGLPLALVVGHGNPRPFAAQAAKLGVGQRVLFAGGTQRIAAFFHAADVLVHPTYYDPCSRVVLEALSAGLPVITTAYNGAGEIIAQGREGYVIDRPEDVAALADCIGRLGDHAHRAACARNGPACVAPFTMRKHAEQVLQIYEELRAHGGSRHGDDRS